MNNVSIRVITNNIDSSDEIQCYIKEVLRNINHFELEMTPLIPYFKIDNYGEFNIWFKSETEINQIKKLFADKWVDDIADSNNKMIDSHIYCEHINFLYISTYENIYIALGEFFTVIDTPKEKEDFYYAQDRGGNLVDDKEFYKDYINTFEFDKDCEICIDSTHADRLISGSDENDLIDITGYTVYSEIPHYPSFKVIKYESLKEVENYLKSERGLCNAFTGNIIVLYNGNLKKYRVKNKEEEIITYEDIDFSIKSEVIAEIVWI